MVGLHRREKSKCFCISLPNKK